MRLVLFHPALLEACGPLLRARCAGEEGSGRAALGDSRAGVSGLAWGGPRHQHGLNDFVF